MVQRDRCTVKMVLKDKLHLHWGCEIYIIMNDDYSKKQEIDFYMYKWFDVCDIKIVLHYIDEKIYIQQRNNRVCYMCNLSGCMEF